MITQLTSQIRTLYLDLEQKKDTRQNIKIKLNQITEEISSIKEQITFLEKEREFYNLINLYESFKDLAFPQELLDVVIPREVYVAGHLCFGYTVSDLTFGEWLDLWKNGGWLYKENPVIFSIHTSAGGYIQYWDLKTEQLKKAKPKKKYGYPFKKSPSEQRSLKTVQDIIRFIRN